MKKTCLTIVASAAALAASYAGTSAPAPVGKAPVGKNPPIVAKDECPDMLKYSYLEAGWIHLDVDNVGSSDGGYLDLSYEVAPRFTIDGSFTLLRGDFDEEDYAIGIGTYIPVCKYFHLVGRTGYSHNEFEDGNSNAWYITPGFRALLGCNLELWGKVYFVVDEDEESFSFGGGITYHFNENYGLSTGYAFSEDNDAWSAQAGLRFQW
jgi:hypothetical protein